MVKIGVLGAGSWGLGLAMLLHNNGHDVTVWSVFPAVSYTHLTLPTILLV